MTVVCTKPSETAVMRSIVLDTYQILQIFCHNEGVVLKITVFLATFFGRLYFWRGGRRGEREGTVGRLLSHAPQQGSGPQRRQPSGGGATPNQLSHADRFCGYSEPTVQGQERGHERFPPPTPLPRGNQEDSRRGRGSPGQCWWQKKEAGAPPQQGPLCLSVHLQAMTDAGTLCSRLQCDLSPSWPCLCPRGCPSVPQTVHPGSSETAAGWPSAPSHGLCAQLGEGLSVCGPRPACLWVTLPAYRQEGGQADHAQPRVPAVFSGCVMCGLQDLGTPVPWANTETGV